MTRLLILSSDTGEGHNSAAAAVQNSAEKVGLRCSIRKPLEESGATNRLLGKFYNALLRYRPQSMTWYFGFINRARPNELDIFYPRAQRYIRRLLEEQEQPDILLSIHPMLNHFIQRYVKEARLPIACYTFLTDPFPPFWRGWASPFVDRYFVATHDALKALVAAGIPASRIERVAMPLREGFRPASMSEIQDFRATFKLDGASTVLINGGARGGGPLFKIYKTVRQTAPNSNILVVCGRNQRLRWRIERLRHHRTRTFGFVDDLHRYIGASDLVVTKPGALSTYEALACGVPVVLAGIEGLMPQESGLFEAARHYGFGFPVQTFEELKAAITIGPGEWNRKRDSVSQFCKYGSREELVERIHSADVRA